MMRYIPLLLIVFTLTNCKSDTNTKEVKTTRPETAMAASDKENPMEAMPMEEIQKMYNEVDQIDYEFHTLPISMALSEKQGIQNNVSYISPTVQWNIPENCKPLGKQLFYKNAEIRWEADFYFDDECRFLVFLEDGKPRYCNKFTPHGQNFYENVFKQVSGLQPNQ